MIVDIPRPDMEARIAIIQNKIGTYDLEFDRDVIAYLAEHIETNIREIEGVINTIRCQTDLKQRSLTITEVKKLVKGDNRPKKTLSAEELIKIIADFYHIEAELIPGKTRKKEIVRPRQISMYIMREHYKASYPTIGEKLGGRDHTTVIHSCDKIKRELREDQLLVQQIEQIQSLL
jgi:chromosomal replication initiator protein